MIPGGAADDCLLSSLLPCCAANQMLQTSQRHGNVSIGGGYRFNRQPWRYDVGSMGEDPLQCAYASLCCCPATGRALGNAMGMPWLLGCCCVTPCAARNLVRYQYRLDGDDLLEEASLPISTALLATGAVYSPIAALPLLALLSLQTDNEARHRSGGGVAGGYLTTKGFRPRNSRARLAHVRGAAADGAGGTVEVNEDTPLLRGGRGGGGEATPLQRQDKDKRSQDVLRELPHEEDEDEGEGEGEPAPRGGKAEREKLRQLAWERVSRQPAVAAVAVDEFQAATWASAETAYEVIA